MNAYFLIHDELSTNSFKLFKLSVGTFCLGRSLSCEFVIPDETVSRRHAEIAVANHIVRVRDLNSRNGTFLDGKRISECIVKLGDRLSFGDVTFQLQSPEMTSEHTDEQTASRRHTAQQFVIDQGKFSEAENRVYKLLLEGFAEKEISRKLHLSRHTVHNHIRAIYRILQVHTRAELHVVLARKHAD